LSTPYANVRNLLRSRLVLAPPEQPEDGRVLNLFRNRAELKKAFGNAQDEIHRLRDRIKLQEAATARVRELLESLESRLSVQATGLQALVHYQLRTLWTVSQSRVDSLVRELSAQREDFERKQHAAEQNRLRFEVTQNAQRQLANAERNCADVRTKLSAVQQELAANSAWWKYFRRQALQRRRHAMQAELVATEADLLAARERVEAIEREGTPAFPGVSLEARRAINLAAIAYAHVIMTRLAPTGLIEPATVAMSRSEPQYSAEGAQPQGAAPLAMMSEIARARSMIQGSGAAAIGVKQISDQLREVARYTGAEDTMPTAESLDTVLRPLGAGGERGRINVLRDDLWGLGSLLI
jgi:hypothetical protein